MSLTLASQMECLTHMAFIVVWMATKANILVGEQKLEVKYRFDSATEEPSLPSFTSDVTQFNLWAVHREPNHFILCQIDELYSTWTDTQV